MPNLGRQTKGKQLRGRNGYCKPILEETERMVACGDTRKFYQMVNGVSRRPAKVGKVFLERNGSTILLCGQSCLLGLGVCAAVTRARHQREAGLSVPLKVAGQ